MTYEIYAYGQTFFLSDELTDDERHDFISQGAVFLTSGEQPSLGAAQRWFVNYVRDELKVPVELDDEDMIYEN